MTQYIGIAEAAKIIGVSKTAARTWLQYADEREDLPGGVFRALYCKKRVCEVKRQRECAKCIREGEKGKWSCRSCPNKCNPCEMRSGLCLDCQARKAAYSFITCGSCCSCDISESRRKALIEAAEKA